ncbi:MAG: hypothetical protein ACK40G_10350 [Cytophagaceae bacterium]
MRVVTEFSTDFCKVTVFAWNNKYLLKLENPFFEQTFKVSEMDLTGDADIINLTKDEVFMKEALERFKEMSRSLQEGLQRV